jgi:hypothetical protein
MITNIGKNILAKYLLGHTSSYASHLAIGCGATPLGQLDLPSDNADIYEAKQNLDFEMFRIPITSRGYVKENDNTYVVFTAELPTTERYGITEIGIYSSGSNPDAGVYDSKIIKSFSDVENWEFHQTSIASEIPTISSSLDDGSNIISILDSNDNPISAFRVSSNNPTFLYEDRVSRYEVPRFLDSSIVVSGDSATISLDEETGNLIPDDTISSHIHLTGTSVLLDQNAPTDELKLAFSLINKTGASQEEESEVSNPEEIRIVIEFASGEGNDIQSASMEVLLINGVDYDFSTNRYFVVTKQLQDLRKTIGFSWDQVSIIKAYASVIDNGESSDEYYIAYDGLRLENTTSTHPLYGLTGYTVVKNDTAYPIVKDNNSSSFAEFRFSFQLNEYAIGS